MQSSSLEADWYFLIWKDKTFLEINLLRSCWFNLWQKVSWIQFITQLFFGGRLPAWWMPSGQKQKCITLRNSIDIREMLTFSISMRVAMLMISIIRDMRVMLIIPVVMLMITTKTMCWQFQLSEWWWHLDTVDIFNNQSDVDKQAMLTFSILAFPIRIRGLLQFSNEIRIILSLGAYLQIRLCNQGIKYQAYFILFEFWLRFFKNRRCSSNRNS